MVVTPGQSKYITIPKFYCIALASSAFDVRGQTFESYVDILYLEIRNALINFNFMTIVTNSIGIIMILHYLV